MISGGCSHKWKEKNLWTQGWKERQLESGGQAEVQEKAQSVKKGVEGPRAVAHSGTLRLFRHDAH